MLLDLFLASARPHGMKRLDFLLVDLFDYRMEGRRISWLENLDSFLLLALAM